MLPSDHLSCLDRMTAQVDDAIERSSAWEEAGQTCLPSAEINPALAVSPSFAVRNYSSNTQDHFQWEGEVERGQRQ
jgi:hypothetical protein